jgi:hypothetical protein
MLQICWYALIVDIWVVFLPLWIMLLQHSIQVFVCSVSKLPLNFSGRGFLFSQACTSKSGIAGSYIVTQCLTIWRVLSSFPMWLYHFMVPQTMMCEFQSFQVLVITSYSLFDSGVTLVGMKWCLIVVWFASLLTKDAEHPFMCLFGHFFIFPG